MNNKITKVVTPILLGLSALGPISSAWASERLNWKQRKELFLEGTVTDDKNQVWDIILVPGVDNINSQADDGWKQLGSDMTELGHSEFWGEVGDQAKDGVEFSKDVVMNQWLRGIKGDFLEAIQQNQSITPGEIGSTLERVASWSWFGIKVIARSIWMPVGSSGGLAYSIVAPAVTAVGLPVGSLLYNGAGRGAVVPAVLYVWNGVAWVGTSFGHVPTHESAFVTLEYQDPQSGQTVQLVIDGEGFKTLVQASVLESLTADEKAQLQAKIDALQAQIDALQKQQANLGNQQDQDQQKLDNSAAQQALNKLYDQALAASKISLSQDAKNMYLDQSKLREVVSAYLQSLGVASPSSAMIDAIVQRIAQNLNDMHVQMQKAAKPDAQAVTPAPLN